ncbi:DivIVA domain-containing protein [Dysosmobacter sp.]|uniref:DivIVA domain-containing protein n=1 Tax=Dysosmobacter sp. TaxID=2591382 RepID=UPI002A8497A1|nr:DivIVA domain-containing protein [Dysosmobacter sp.]MDY3985654.1 DivIVA domain-containing protein [Dysosmobacter sp.]
MLTPQEVSTHAFTKAVMGGYNMAMVDEFLDELTDDYTALYKENAALKSKMKVLVEKVEDYRATEDSMRATLLTAQKMADSIVHEAEAKRDALLAQAETEARDRIAQLRREAEEAEERLRQGQQELARFIAASREVCNRELSFLDQLPQLPVETAAPAQEAPVEEIEEKVMAAFAPQEEEKAPEEPAEEEVPEEEAPAPADNYPEGDPFATEEASEPTRRINLNDLKFGRNYNGED